MGKKPRIIETTEYDATYQAGYTDGYNAGWAAALNYEDGYEPDVDEEQLRLPYILEEEDYH
jgi:hypothetical protein